MPKGVVEDASRDLIPEDLLLTVELRAVKEREISYRDKETNEQKSFVKWEWEFLIKGGDYDGKKVWGDTDGRLSNHPDNRPRNWAETLLGRSIDVGVEFDTDDVLGLTCQVEVEHQEYIKNGEARTIAKVSALYPLAGATPFEALPPF